MDMFLNHMKKKQDYTLDIFFMFYFLKLKMVNLSFHIENPSFTCVQYITMKRRKKGKTLIEVQTQTWNISSPDAINN